MKSYRYGDPLYQAPRRGVDLAGQRFAMLTAIEPAGTQGSWRCQCDCGSKTVVRSWSLTSAKTQSCGCLRNWRIRQGKKTDLTTWASYSASHQRLRDSRGPAKNYNCVDCEKPARQWSYTRNDPHELITYTTSKNPVPYSSDPQYYSPRCISCHKKFDLTAIGSRRLK